MPARCLDRLEKELLGRYVAAVDLDLARLHENQTPWYLLPGFVGITLGNHIYFRPGAYVRGTAVGLALLGHELVHVAQFRRGMTVLGYLLSCSRGYRRSRYEREAFATQRQILSDLNAADWSANDNHAAAMHDPQNATGARH